MLSGLLFYEQPSIPVSLFTYTIHAHRGITSLTWTYVDYDRAEQLPDYRFSEFVIPLWKGV